MSVLDKVIQDLLNGNPKSKKWVGGAGGGRALTADSGALMACYLADIIFDLLVGASGGTLPALAYASGVHPLKLGQLAVDVDFSSLVPSHKTPVHIFFALLLRERFRYTRPKKGVFGSDALGHFVRDLVLRNRSDEEKKLQESLNKPLWVPKFACVAAIARTQVIFTEHGVVQALRNGQTRVLSNEPAEIDIAVRGSCAVPGIIDAPKFLDRHLFDGALTWDGQCPVGMLIRHLNVKAEDIIGCDVGDETHLFSGTLRWFWSLVCGGHCVDIEGPKVPIPEGVLMLRPNVWSLRSLQFNVGTEQKWQGVMSGFQEATIQLERAGLLKGDARKRAFDICMDMEKLKALSQEAE
jgi:predicted acylesterase/phospholipase RssA